jgi:hypothetical protein
VSSNFAASVDCYRTRCIQLQQSCVFYTWSASRIA